MGFVIDGLQYANWSRDIFVEMRAGGVDAVHATVGYHEDFLGVVANLAAWNRRFEVDGDLVARAVSAGDVRRARAAGKTAVLFGTQNPLALGTDLKRIEICHQLGLRFMQVTYNQQSLLGAGCFEAVDGGLTAFGREAVAEMNRVGLAIDLSHAGLRTAADAVAASRRPVAVTHATPAWWHDTPRSLPHELIAEVTRAGGIFGFSLYPNHLKDGGDCRLQAFAAMVAEAAGRYGAEHLAIGSDLCQGQPDSVVQWMRAGDWVRHADASVQFPAMPAWFGSNRDFPGLRAGLVSAGLSPEEVDGIMGDNWLRFFEASFGPA